MSAAPGRRKSLFGHALAMHTRAPEGPLPRDGEPYPDAERHRRSPPNRPRDPALVGVEAARILQEHFANPVAVPADLVDAFHDIHIPFHSNEHIVTAARATDPNRVRATGRWLVRHSTDQCSAIIGLALLGVAGTVEDIPLIQTIGLLSDKFGAPAATALERQNNGTTSLIWLADRVAGWGRVYVVEAICRLADPAARPWLLRHPVDGDALNGYFAGRVAEISGLHEAIMDPSADDDLVDHAGRLLCVLTVSQGMGVSIEDYSHAAAVLDAHAQHLATQEPTAKRYAAAAKLADYLHGEAVTWPPGTVQRLRDAYVSVLGRDDWRSV